MRSLSDRGALAALLAVFALLPVPVNAQQGHGHWSIGSQFIHIDGFESAVGELPIGTTDTQSLNFEIDYNLTDRITVSAGLPLIRKRYQGPGAHDPSALIPPRDAEFIDDGDFHTHFQDFHLGVRYLASAGARLRIEPFANYSFPSNDYPFFAHAAPGQNLWKFDIGATFSFLPHFSDFYVQVAPSYVFVEETLDVSISHWKLDAELGYFIRPNLSVKFIVQAKDGKGLDFPDDFPPPRTDERWFQHDRLVKHNYVNVGLGFDWTINDRYQLSLAGMTMVHAEQVHVMKYAAGATLSRSF